MISANDIRIEQATTVLFRFRAEKPEAAVERLARAAVEGVFCTRLAFSSEAVECPLDPATEAELVQAIIRRAGLGEDREPAGENPDRVTLASDQSFPASDPPAWIWGEPDPPLRAVGLTEEGQRA